MKTKMTETKKASTTITKTMTKTTCTTQLPSVSFSHVHFYVHHLDDLEAYMAYETKLNEGMNPKTCTTTTTYPTDPTPIIQQEEEYKVTKNTLAKASVSMFESQNRDLVRQLMAGLGFRITGSRYDYSHSVSIDENGKDGKEGSNGEEHNNGKNNGKTRTVLIASRDVDRGVQFVVTAPEIPFLTENDSNNNNDKNEYLNENSDKTKTSTIPSETYHHFDVANLHRFFHHHSNRAGIAVLAFTVDSVDLIHQRYQQYHPNLIFHVQEYRDNRNDDGSTNDITISTKILEVFAYYKKDSETEPEKGTLLRFVESSSSSSSSSTTTAPSNKFRVLPGLHPRIVDDDNNPLDHGTAETSSVSSLFDTWSYPAYCDHWVSNVYSRTGFLQTLEDTLGFTPKVDFNAGVVAAGEAQIESTVTGNDAAATAASTTTTTTTTDTAPIAAAATTATDILSDPSQVYLPINNALSDVGHVSGFLKELGQGIQHIASRVNDLIAFVQQANDRRKACGEGFTFLNIPRSYYGTLTSSYLLMETTNTTTNTTTTMMSSSSTENLNSPTSTATPSGTVLESTSTMISKELADYVVETCRSTNITDLEGAVDLELDANTIRHRLLSSFVLEHEPDNATTSTTPSTSKDKLSFSLLLQDEFKLHQEVIVTAILKSRYINIYNLLKDHMMIDRHAEDGTDKNGNYHNMASTAHTEPPTSPTSILSESSLLGIVRNQILVDVQGNDLLYQIFTSNILQRHAKDEAPFLEFIQRVCGTTTTTTTTTTNNRTTPIKMKPGCGGFGIRNFLTLFLSIEVSKAMRMKVEAGIAGNETQRQLAHAMVECFTEQMNESNPILTDISNAMTREGYCRDMLSSLLSMPASPNDDDDSVVDDIVVDDDGGGLKQRIEEQQEYWKEQLAMASQQKMDGNERLMECSVRYKEKMKSIRMSSSE